MKLNFLVFIGRWTLDALYPYGVSFSFLVFRFWNIRGINPAVAVLTLLTLGDAQTRLALLSLTRKVREIRVRLNISEICEICVFNIIATSVMV